MRHIPVHVARALARYGAQLDLTHERTALSRLSYDWDYAKVIKPPAQGPTVAAHRPRALPLDEAVARVAANDRRPFLVLRECWQCGGGEETDIGRKLANEKTILYAKWFRCVRVSDAVRHPDHPLHALFAGPNAPHLVLGSVHGGVLPVASGEPLSTLWTNMRRLIAEAYEADPDAAVNQELEILSRFDHLDNLEKSLSSRLDEAVETQPAGAPQIATLRQQLADLAVQRSTTEAREQRVMRRTLRKTPTRSTR